MLPLLFTKVTLCPTEIVTLLGLTPLLPIVIVAPLGPGCPPPDGPVGGFPLSELSPHAVKSTRSNAAVAYLNLCEFMSIPVAPPG